IHNPNLYTNTRTQKARGKGSTGLETGGRRWTTAPAMEGHGATGAEARTKREMEIEKERDTERREYDTRREELRRCIPCHHALPSLTTPSHRRH
ncbi:hypothetical protein PIB30_080827, partial [Stylosanthes scabra]|nr:hypothetical protein [Stylosanthes scabra]